MNNERETVLDVEGMSCGSCLRHVTAALTELEGVAKVDVKLRDGIVIVQHDPARSSIAQLVEALGEAGYPSSERAA
ncbi:MAG: heavy-metal-associated domain-containing protein [Myxococcota bacterium]